MSARQLLTIDAVMARTGTGRTKHYEDIKLGLLPEPIRRGERFSRWPSTEIDEIVSARIFGLGDSRIRELVQHQMAARAAQAGAPRQ